MGTTDTDATVTIGIDGTETVLRAAAAIGDAWRATSKSVAAAGKEMGKEISSAFQGMARDALSIATSASRINFAQGAASARDYGLSVSRMAISSGQDIDQLRTRYEGLSRSTMMTQQETHALASGLRGVTYDAKYAVDSVQAIADEAEAIGRSPQQVGQLAASLHNVYGVSGDVGKSMGEIDAIAQQVGGRGADSVRLLHDQLTAADGIMSRFKANSRESAALIATLGKGYTPQQQASAQQSILGAIAGDRVGYERLLRGVGRAQEGRNDP